MIYPGQWWILANLRAQEYHVHHNVQNGYSSSVKTHEGNSKMQGIQLGSFQKRSAESDRFLDYGGEFFFNWKSMFYLEETLKSPFLLVCCSCSFVWRVTLSKSSLLFYCTINEHSYIACFSALFNQNQNRRMGISACE